jgi:hypothetical protein
MRRRIIALVAAVLALGALTAAIALARNVPLDSDWQAVRGALSKYQSYDVALADGYDVREEPCVASPDGTMGYHAANRELIAAGGIDPLRPQILVYIGKPNGKLKLVAAEYFAVALANTANGPAPWFDTTPPPDGFFNSAPSLLGHTFDGPMAGHNPQMPWHYDLHAWLFEANPAGTFTQWNPAISCAAPAG